jgi:ATP-dependent RNA helicase RhlE
MLDRLSTPDEDVADGYPVEDVVKFFGAPQEKFVEMLKLMNITRIPRAQAHLLRTLHQKDRTLDPYLIFGPIGSGKSLVLAIQLARAAHDHVKEGKQGVAAVGLFPTHESAASMERLLACLTWVTQVSCVCMVGGMGMEVLVQRCLSSRPQILVGCPGKMRDFMSRISRGVKKPTKDARLFALDEGNRLLSQDFVEDVKNIKAHSPTAKVEVYSSSFTNAAMANLFGLDNLVPEILKMGDRQTQLMLMDEKWSTVDPAELTNIRKLILRKFKDVELKEPMMIFCSKGAIKKVFHDMSKLYEDVLGTSTSHQIFMLHGGMSEYERSNAMEGFSAANAPKALVATHVAAVGLNFRGLKQIIHLDVPPRIEAYTQAIGRAGRDGQVAKIRTAVTQHKHDVYHEYGMWHTQDRDMKQDGVGLWLDDQMFTGGKGGLMMTRQLMLTAQKLERELKNKKR